MPSPAPAPPARRRTRGPWWLEAGRGAAGTVRDLRDTPDPTRPARTRLVVDPDGTLVSEPVEPKRRRTARVLRAGWRRRRTLAPLPVAAGFAVLNAARFTDPRNLAWAVILAPAVAALAWAVTLGGADRTRGTWAITLTTIAALELWWLAPDGWLPPGAGWGIAALAAAVSEWRFRIRPRQEPPTLELDTAWQVAAWDEYVAAPGGILPGAVATFLGPVYAPADDDEDDGTGDAPEVLEGEVVAVHDDVSRETLRGESIGFRLAVDLVRGRHELSHLASKAGVIAGVYDAERAGTVIEPAGSEIRAVVTITSRAFLAEVKEWRRPTLDLSRGRFVVQTLADGTRGHWQLYIPRQGIRHGWIVGATGGGKSGAIDLVFANALSAGITVADFVDLKGGASAPHWRYRVRRYGTRAEDAVKALYRGTLLCDYRNAVMARMPDVDPDTGETALIDGEPGLGRTWIDPSPDWPIYLIPIEEWPELLLDPVWKPWGLTFAERIARLGRQCLVSFLFTSQGANLDVIFGGSRILRSNVQAGNVLILWTDQGTSNLATATRSVDTTRIPSGEPGVGYMVGPGQRRDMLGRVPWVRRKWDAVNAARPAVLSAKEEAILAAADALHDGAPLDDVRAKTAALFPDDPEWQEIIAEVLGDPATATPTPRETTGPVDPGDGALPAAHYGDPDPDPDELTRQQAAIIDALSVGPASTADLRAILGGVTDQALRRHLDPLLDGIDGAPPLVVKVGRGRYTLPALPAPIDPPQET